MSLHESWFEEKQSAWLYRHLAEREPDEDFRRLFGELAEAAEGQAGTWARKAVREGESFPEFRPTPRARVVAALLKLFRPKTLRPILAAMKVRGLSVYAGRKQSASHPMPTAVDEIERQHRSASGGNLRAAVFGINDGLVSNTSLILGVAGAGTSLGVVMTSGVAGLLAGALSMAAGEYVSMRSQREMYEYQINLERQELAEYPEEEAEELALIYHARGMDLEEARSVAKAMLQDPEHALDTLSREELGLNPDDLGSPWGAAIFSFLAFTAGAIIPLLPFLAGSGLNRGIVISGGLAGVCLFGVGAALSLFSGRSALRGGLRMVLIGGGAGLVTFFIGHALGVGLN
jgi:VIT1/CCC1 family predicted Fe2+/Mn2+ transporter